MVSVIENSDATDDQAKCLVREFKNPLEKCNSNNKFECLVDRKKTVRQFIHIVAQHYNLDVDSFYLTFSSFKLEATEAKTLDKVTCFKIIFSLNKYINNIFSRN